MIRLTIAPEPASFSRAVREPGENVLALLAGRPAPHERVGRPIEPTRSIGGQRVAKSVADFPYWQQCLDELHAAYGGICAYYCFYIEKASLPHVDHFVAKHDQAGELAYEWRNYRLACGYANACKSEYPEVCDPAAIEDGWFQLDLDTLDVRPDPSLPAELRAQVEATIVRLKLREGRALEVRQRAMAHFRGGRALFGFLELDHPFIAKELARRGIREAAQLPRLPASIVDRVEPEL